MSCFMRSNVRLIALLGLATFGSNLVWPIYNSFLPIFYGEFLSSTALIGLAMSLDNVIAVAVGPYFGAVSDRTRTRVGRRMPFLLAGIPLSALFLALLPVGAHLGLVWLLAVTVLMNLSWRIFAAPLAALMPDLVPSRMRSQVSGVLTVLGGLGGAVALLGGGALFRIHEHLPFAVFASCLVLIVIVLAYGIREPAAAAAPADAAPGVLAALRKALASPDKSLIYLCLSAFLWYIGYAGVEALFSLYARHVLGLHAGDAAITLGSFAAGVLLMAAPAGFLASRIGRRQSVRIGLLGLIVVFLSITLVPDVVAWRVLLLLGGALWALIVVNAYPMVVDMCHPSEIGTYTAIWVFSVSLSAITAPPLFGAVVDVAGFDVLFIVAAACLAGALLLSGRVQQGEARRLAT
jgi:maltose/moltooligosaccharide transporter